MVKVLFVGVTKISLVISLNAAAQLKRPTMHYRGVYYHPRIGHQNHSKKYNISKNKNSLIWPNKESTQGFSRVISSNMASILCSDHYFTVFWPGFCSSSSLELHFENICTWCINFIGFAVECMLSGFSDDILAYSDRFSIKVRLDIWWVCCMIYLLYFVGRFTV